MHIVEVMVFSKQRSNTIKFGFALITLNVPSSLQKVLKNRIETTHYPCMTTSPTKEKTQL